MLFADVIGQQSVKELLANMVTHDRIPHALLFLGPEGSGKLAMALAFAQLLLCENPGPEGACGQCSPCNKAAKLIHPDLHFSFPTVGTNVTADRYLPEWRSMMEENPYQNVNQWLQAIGAENKQGNINKEECLNIIRKLSLKIFEGNYKVLVMWLPEYLGKEGNRLLKIIEEPPERTIFLLVAENQDLILNTILSRCQLVRFQGLSDEDVAGYLSEQFKLPQEQAYTLAQIAAGNLNEARTLATEAQDLNAQQFVNWLRKCYKGHGVELSEWVEEFAGIGRENQKHFLRYGLHFMREYMLMKMTGSGQARLRPEELAVARNMTRVIEFDQLELIVQLLTDCSYYVERNAHPKVLFMDASIQLHKILKRVQVRNFASTIR